MNHQKIIYQKSDLSKIVKIIMSYMDEYRVFTLTGALGAGKTTLVRSLLSELGIQEPITSPTFTYVNIYTLSTGKKVYHFDLYRVKSPQEFVDAGFDEYLNDPDGYVFIEWPEVIEKLLPKKRCDIVLEHVDAEHRSISLEGKS